MGSQGSAKLNRQTFMRSPERDDAMDFDADLDIDQLLDEEMR